MIKIARDIEKYPELLTRKRNEIECNFVLSLWKDPESIGDYLNLKNGEDIITEDGQFYFGLAQQLYKLGHRNFDHITLHTFLTDKSVLKEEYEKRGGHATVQEIMGLLNIDNIDAYYDEVIKNNALLDLHTMGFDVEKNLAKFTKMTSSELYDFLDYKLNNIFLDKVEKLAVEDLSTGYDEYLERWDKGVMKGYPIGFPILNYRLAGVHKSNLLLHLAHIGNGKTTSSLLFYVLPVIERGEDVMIIANEQGVEEFRQMIFTTVLFNKIKYRDINRQKFIQGGFLADNRDQIEAAKHWLETQAGHIKFMPVDDYNFGRIKKIIKKHSKTGVGLFLIDTMKPEQENATAAWANFSESAKEIFELAKKEDVAIIATAQLSGESMARRFLDLSCTGKSKAIAETATQVVMFRNMTQEEKEKLFVYNLRRNPETGKFENIKEQVKLEEDKEYIILFTPKNRFGDTQPQIVYERNMAWNSMKEIGLTVISYDGFGR